MKPLNSREVLARLEIIKVDCPHLIEQINHIAAKFKALGNIPHRDVQLLGLEVRPYTRNGERGFSPVRGDTTEMVHYLNYKF